MELSFANNGAPGFIGNRPSKRVARLMLCRFRVGLTHPIHSHVVEFRGSANNRGALGKGFNVNADRIAGVSAPELKIVSPLYNEGTQTSLSQSVCQRATVETTLITITSCPLVI
jgi:hypothetical protein